MATFEGAVLMKLYRDKILEQQWLHIGIRKFLADSNIVIEILANLFDDFVAYQLLSTTIEIH